MGLTNLSVHNSTTEPYQYVKMGAFGADALPKHKGFAITTGLCGADTTFNYHFDVLLKTSTGATFYNRISVPQASTAYFPVQIAGVSGDPTWGVAGGAGATGLDAHTLMYYY